MKRNSRLGQQVPVLVGAVIGFVPVNSIKNWRDAHGTTIDGTKVNSPSFTNIGNSTIIKDAGGHAFSLATPDAEILAVEMAKSFGYDVKPGKGTRQAA